MLIILHQMFAGKLATLWIFLGGVWKIFTKRVPSRRPLYQQMTGWLQLGKGGHLPWMWEAIGVVQMAPPTADHSIACVRSTCVGQASAICDLLGQFLEEQMAIDVYLNIDGIKGESLDSAHQNWIECTSARWGVLQPKSATASTAGGHTAERCEHKSISITKLTDLSSPLLMQTCSMGRTIPKVTLEFMRADGDGKPIKYYEVELENVLIGSVDQAVHEGSGMHDSVTLKFSKVRWKYTQQKIGGGTAGNTAGSWNLATNRLA